MMEISLLKMRRVSVSLFLIYSLAYYVFITMYRQSNSLVSISNFFTLMGEIAAIIIILYGIPWYEKEQRLEWIFFAMGIFFNFVGDIVWTLYDIVWKVEIPTISACDIFYLLGSFMFIVAIFTYIRKEKIFSIIKTGFDIAIVMVVSTTFIFKYLLIPVWSDVELSFLEKTVLLSYPIIDIGYLGGLFSIMLNNVVQEKRHRTNLYLIIGFCFFFIADIGFLVFCENNLLEAFFDTLWPIGFLSIAIASLYRNFKSINTKSFNDYGKKKRVNLLLNYCRFLFPYCLGSLLIIIVSFKYISKDPLITGSVITVLLIMIRQIFSLLENQKLVSMLETTNNLLGEHKADLELKNRNLKKLKELKEMEARTDYLTGLYNRRYAYEWLEKYIDSYSGNEVIEVSILLIDIDYYKQINDTWGHDTGDIVLKQIVHIIKNNIRLEDMAGRYGGDEFVILLPKTSKEVAKSIAERLLKEVHMKTFAENEELKVTLSIGNFHWQGKKEDCSMDKLIGNADEALYEAKAKGRDRVITI